MVSLINQLPYVLTEMQTFATDVYERIPAKRPTSTECERSEVSKCSAPGYAAIQRRYPSTCHAPARGPEKTPFDITDSRDEPHPLLEPRK